MSASRKAPIVFIHTTSTHRKLTSLDLSAIRTHTARRQHRRSRGARAQLPQRDQTVLCQVKRTDAQDDAAFGPTGKNDLLFGLDTRIRSDTIRSDPFDSFPIPANDAISLAVDYCGCFPAKRF